MTDLVLKLWNKWSWLIASVVFISSILYFTTLEYPLNKGIMPSLVLTSFALISSGMHLIDQLKRKMQRNRSVKHTVKSN